MFGPPDPTTQPGAGTPVPRAKRRRSSRARRAVNPRGTRHSASPELRLAALLRDGLACQLCGVQLTLHDKRLPTHGVAGHRTAHLDGGLPTADNLRAECMRCSTAGGARLAAKAVAMRRAELERQRMLRGC